MSMGGYGWYVWSSYVFVLICFSGLLLSSVRKSYRVKRRMLTSQRQG